MPQRDNGIAAIYQELAIIPEMSALSNVFLGEVPNRWFVVDRRGMEKRFNELAEWMGVKISPHATAKTLSVANQQMLEIMRAVHAEHDVIIMDEPTAPLGPFERSRLYDLIGRLKENNVSIIFISHDLDEVLRLCDRVSVMRDGQLIETRQSSGWTKDSLVKTMLGDIQIVAGRKRERRRAETASSRAETCRCRERSPVSISNSARAKFSGLQAWSARAERKCSDLSPASNPWPKGV